MIITLQGDINLGFQNSGHKSSENGVADVISMSSTHDILVIF